MADGRAMLSIATLDQVLYRFLHREAAVEFSSMPCYQFHDTNSLNASQLSGFDVILQFLLLIFLARTFYRGSSYACTRLLTHRLKDGFYIYHRGLRQK